MEVNKLATFTLFIVLIGMVAGTGILIFDKFSTAVYTDKTVSNESFVWPLNGSTVTLTNGNITSFSKVANIAGTAYLSGNYSVDTDTGVVTALSNTSGIITGATVYAYYTWRDRSSATNTALWSTRNGIADIPNSWLSLIVTVGVLAVILYFVLRSFGGRR